MVETGPKLKLGFMNTLEDIHMNSNIYGENDCNLDLDLLTVLYELQVSYPRKTRLARKVNI